MELDRALAPCAVNAITDLVDQATTTTPFATA